MIAANTPFNRAERAESSNFWPQRLAQLVSATLSTAGWQLSRTRSNDAKLSGLVAPTAMMMPRMMEPVIEVSGFMRNASLGLQSASLSTQVIVLSRLGGGQRV